MSRMLLKGTLTVSPWTQANHTECFFKFMFLEWERTVKSEMMSSQNAKPHSAWVANGSIRKIWDRVCGFFFSFCFLCLLLTGMHRASYPGFQSVGCCSLCESCKGKASLFGFSHFGSFRVALPLHFFFLCWNVTYTYSIVCMLYSVLPLSV